MSFTLTVHCCCKDDVWPWEQAPNSQTTELQCVYVCVGGCVCVFVCRYTILFVLAAVSVQVLLCLCYFPLLTIQGYTQTHTPCSSAVILDRLLLAVVAIVSFPARSFFLWTFSREPGKRSSGLVQSSSICWHSRGLIFLFFHFFGVLFH